VDSQRELALQFPCFGEVFEAAVVGFLSLGREATAWQLLGPQVFVQTIAACALGGAVVRAGASVDVDLFLAFHFRYLSKA